MPRDDNAAVLAGRVAERLSDQGPARAGRAIATTLRRLRHEATGSVPPRTRHGDQASDGEVAGALAPGVRRAVRALLRDTVSLTALHAGGKDNVIPGTATLQLDCRSLPGTDEAAMRDEIERRIGRDLRPACTIELVRGTPAIEQPLDHPILPVLEASLLRHDPGALVVPSIAPFSTDAKHTSRVGIPTYGFTPLRMPSGEFFLDRFHADDERVPVESLAFGVVVLHDAVVEYCRVKEGQA